MKITKVEGIPFAIPYRKPLRFASGEVTEATHVLVRVHTDEGLVGTAEAPPRPFTYGETQASILAIIRTVFGPQVVGLSPLGARADPGPPQPDRRQSRRQVGHRHGRLGRHRPVRRAAGHRAARRLRQPDARRPHGGVRRASIPT